ncbi:MAG: carboxypeptidase regulatory-like domain-containing protein [Phycisphaerae bacterium]
MQATKTNVGIAAVILMPVLAMSGTVYAQTATIGGLIYTGANDGTGPVMAPTAAALSGAQVMVQNQHSGGAFITYGTVTGNSWTATVPAPGDYVVMFSAVGHDATSRGFTVADGDIQSKDAYLPPLFTNPDGTPSGNQLPLANLLVYTFYDNMVNGEDDAPDDPPLNGVTVKAWDEDGNLLATGITGTMPSPIVTADGMVIPDTRGLYYFTGLPPGEVLVTSDPSTVHLYDVNGALSLGGVNNLVTRSPLDFDATTEFYLMSSEEGGMAFEAVLYPGDPGTEDGGYLAWHGYVRKMGQITAANATDPDRFPFGANLAQAGSINGQLTDSDTNINVFEPVAPGELEPMLSPIFHPGTTANVRVPDGFVVLFTNDETMPTHPVATVEADPVTGYFEFLNVPPGKYKLFLSDIPIDYVYVSMQVAPGPNQTIALAPWQTFLPRFYARVQGHVIDRATGMPLAGATVNIRYKDGSIQHTTTTDATGWYNFDNMPEIEVLAHVDVEPPTGYRGAIVTDTFYPNAAWAVPFCDPAVPGCVIPGTPYTVTHNAINRYVQWYTANYQADLFVEPIPAAAGQLDGFVFNDRFDVGTWASDGVFDPSKERTMHGVTIELWDATGTAPILDAVTGLPVTATTGALDKTALEAQGWTAPYTVPPDEWGGVFAGPMVGYFEFRDVPAGAYTVKLNLPDPLAPDPLHPLNGFATTTPDAVAVTVVGGAGVRANFGVNTTPAGSAIGVPLAGEIEGGVFDDLIIDPNPTSSLYMEKRGVPGVPVGVFDHLGYRLGVGLMGNPNCNPVNNAVHTPGDAADARSCPPGQPIVQKPEMERRFAPGAHIYVGNDPTQAGYDPDYLPLVLPYTFGQGQFKFEADWSLVPVSIGGQGGTAWAANAFLPPPPPLPAPVINNVAPVGSYLITGANFGDTRGFSTVTLAGRELEVTSWSDTAIHVNDPPVAISGPMIVTTWGGSSNAFHVDVGSVPESSVFVSAGAVGGDGSQANPFGSISAALNHLPPATPRYVFVAAGTYHEHIQITEPDVRIIGAGPNETVLDGRPTSLTVTSQGFTNGGGPVIFIGQGGETGSVANIVISGLTVKGGSVHGEIGAGIFGDFGNRNIDINNCIITENGGYYGGGIWLHHSNHDVKIWSNTISRNGNPGGYGGGISVNDEPEYGEEHGEPEHIWDDHRPGCPPGTYEIFNNHILRNFSPDYGGGIALYEIKDHLILAGNLIEDNKADDHGGGAFFEDTGPVDMYGNTFRRNYCRDDGGAVSFEDVGDDNASVMIYDNLFAENIADDCGENTARGGAIAFDDTFYAEVFNNTIVGNIVAGSYDPAGGGIDSERNGHEYNGSEPLGRNIAPGFSDPIIHDNIIWGNQRLHYDQPMSGDEEDLDFTFGVNYVWTPDNLHVDNPAVQSVWETANNSESFTQVENNDISDGAYAGRVGNVNADPQFVDPAGLDWSLAATSPVANLGVRTDTSGGAGLMGPLAGTDPMCIVSCFGVNKAKIGTKETRCEGIEAIEVTSTGAAGEELVGLYLPDEGHDTLPDTTVMDDGVNGSVVVDTSCAQPIAMGDVFGPYTVTDIVKSYDGEDDAMGNDVEIRGSFDSALPFDPFYDYIFLVIDDAAGHTATIGLPPGLFEQDGDPQKRKFKYKGPIPGTDMSIKAKFKGCEFKMKVKGVQQTNQLVGTTINVGLLVGQNYGIETIVMVDKNNHLKYKRDPKLDCCPETLGFASLQVTSGEGVLVFEPAPGHDMLPESITIDDGVHEAVTIDTSGGESIAAGQVFGPYTVSEVVEVFDEDGH